MREILPQDESARQAGEQHTAAAEPTCPACGHDVVGLFTRINGWDIIRCVGCRMRWVFPLPPNEELLGYYSIDYFQSEGEGYRSYLGNEESHRKTARKRLSELREYVSEGVVLDVGCAAGFFLDEAQQSEFHVHGIELCEEIAAVARDRFGIRVDSADFSHVEAEASSFDAITLYNVIAHLGNPRDTIHKARHLLRRGGLLVIETWNADSLAARLLGPKWPFYSPPSGLYFFGHTTLRCLLEQSGFEVLGTSSQGNRFSLDAVTAVLKHKFPSRFWRWADAWACRRGRASQVSIPFSFGQLVTVFARPAAAGEAASDPPREMA